MIYLFFNRQSRSEKADPLAHDFIEVVGGVEPALEEVADEERAERDAEFEDDALDVGTDVAAVEDYRAFVILH